MLINNKSKYAVIAMIALAKSGQSKPVKLADLARRVGISQSYLEPMFKTLKAAGLVTGVRGPGGGYNATSLDITALEIVEAIMPEPKYSGEDWEAVAGHVAKALKGRKLSDSLI